MSRIRYQQSAACQEIDAWFNATPELQSLHNFYYTNLNIVDSKANALLRVNAIGVAALALVANLVPGTGFADLAHGRLWKTLGVLTLALLVWSVVRLASMNFVKWTTTEELTGSLHDCLEPLVRLRHRRTRILDWAAGRSIVALGLLALIFGWVLIQRSWT
jgi:hypothetical protein